MTTIQTGSLAPTSFGAPQTSCGDWAALLTKLRWLGLDDQARYLETALQSLPAEQRHGAVFDPVNTD